MSRELIVDGTRIADDTECYVIAEIGHNHQGSVEKCKELFRVARECGVDAVKLQKRHNRTLFTRAMYDRSYHSENAFAPTYGEHREFLEFGWDEYVELKRYATEELGVTLFSTAFDLRSADFLAKLDIPAYKIASGDLTNTPLLKHVASIGKPMIISTGGAIMEDVQRAYDAVMPINPDLCIMQCTSGYPCEYEELNLQVIEVFRKTFPDVVIGYSGHDGGIAMSVVAYVLGARVVEKHFTLHRAAKGADHAFSLERSGLRRMVRDLRRSRVALGDGVKKRYESEEAPLGKMAKKLVAARDLNAGTVLAPEDIAIKIAEDGIPPYEFDNFVGMKLLRPLAEDESLTHDTIVDA